MKKIFIINGANLNLIGVRSPIIYGSENLDTINDYINRYCKKNDIKIEFFQSNIEGEIINKIHSSIDNQDGIIINPGAYAHYSYAIRDAIESIIIPTIEVHLSNIYTREEFRRKSIISPVCVGVISGFGKEGYILALDAIKNILRGY
ncbi:MAG: type II 3-dehydroquinate dehydratase [Oscillospiraceae bacterium]|nr:type II 3-dehydroquinate dehydratase [Oscillospiraceae bacterium]